MIRYQYYSIIELTHIETGEKFYNLKHWYISDENREVSGCRDAGIFPTREAAAVRHKEMINEGLLKNE